jgi:RNA polymerase subunit RPABC4/transcription elongation factor Spt4
MVKEEEKCKFCGKSRFTQSTEQKDNVWVSEKICEFCGRVVKTHTFKERVKDTERKDTGEKNDKF